MIRRRYADAYYNYNFPFGFNNNNIFWIDNVFAPDDSTETVYSHSCK
jgi:hypothetical protein